MTGDTHAGIHRYHDGTKHHFHRFAPSLGYLDWASQPDPFRSFAGAPTIDLPRARRLDDAPLPISLDTIGDVLRHSLGLSAWKRFRESRWSLRVNPSSGNLHPTEAYVVAGPAPGLSEQAGVYHYASDRHALERRCAFAAEGWRDVWGDAGTLLVALTSIHWREAWKYGERAFRYCQHDLGHAMAAVRLAGALVGWPMAIVPAWSHRDIAALIGLDRDEDYVEAEREEPACLLYVGSGFSRTGAADRADLINVVRDGSWSGRASRLSEDHVEWTFIDEIVRVTEEPGRDASYVGRDFSRADPAIYDRDLYARALILQRRSALAFDGRSSTDLPTFIRMLSRAMPAAHPPWDALWWAPRVHLALFVHRVDGLAPGLYLLVREDAAIERLKAACRPDFLWEPASDALPLFCLARGDCRALAARVSCDQDIAGDGFFSLGMIADFDRSLDEFGPSFYRHLFWETGVVGQVLYLEAEAAGARATGIGCFYDDPMHDLLGLEGHAFQSLYHFTVGMPVEDTRLTTEPGYEWER